MHQDPIADMLTRIRNGNQRKHISVNMPSSKMKKAIAEVLKAEGYIVGYTTKSDNNKESITIDLKYKGDERVIKGIKRVSKPGLRVYANATDIPRVLNGFGIAIVSTPKGLLTDKTARKANVGGEIVAYV